MIRRWPNYEHQLCQIPQLYGLKNVHLEILTNTGFVAGFSAFHYEQDCTHNTPWSIDYLTSPYPTLSQHRVCVWYPRSVILFKLSLTRSAYKKPFSLSQSTLKLTESNNALFETALLLFAPMACHSEYPVLSLQAVQFLRCE